jgi:hypothetical protein
MKTFGNGSTHHVAHGKPVTNPVHRGQTGPKHKGLTGGSSYWVSGPNPFHRAPVHKPHVHKIHTHKTSTLTPINGTLNPFSQTPTVVKSPVHKPHVHKPHVHKIHTHKTSTLTPINGILNPFSQTPTVVKSPVHKTHAHKTRSSASQNLGTAIASAEKLSQVAAVAFPSLVVPNLLWQTGKVAFKATTFLDKKVDASGAIANVAYAKIGPAPKGVISIVDRIRNFFK